MKTENFTFADPQGYKIYVYKWQPDSTQSIKGIVQISHGMAEAAERYQRFAHYLTNEGYVVYANDHRGHGKSSKSIEELGRIGKDGFNWMIENQYQLNNIIREQNPNLPIFLFGHSMGSFISRQYISRYGDTLRGVILSGSNGLLGIEVSLGILLAKLQVKIIGETAKSNLLNNMSFGSFNKAFRPNRTDFDWLSRDSAEVDRYIANPYCGTVFPASFFYEFFRCLKGLKHTAALEGIPKELPIYIIAGNMDPVGKFGKGVTYLANTYKGIGIKDVALKLYDEGRHEMLNEINRDEVMRDITFWITKYIL